ncbi:MAG: ABC transporter substrate-binding protein [Chlorobi bacterium]|nr:ABC transporter substrate-binding protein [Chlorobiota bacterium]
MSVATLVRSSLAIAHSLIKNEALTPYVFFGFMLILSSCNRTSIQDEFTTYFRYNEPDGIASLDPALASYQSAVWATGHLYNGLVELDSSLNIAPCIASSWEISLGGTRLTFHLRPDVWFHTDTCFIAAGYPEGARTVTAQDVVFSIKRIYDGSAKSTGAWVYRDRITSVAAPDDTTVVFTLSAPFAPFLALLTMPYGYIVPHEAVSFYGDDFGQHPVGTGPFMFKQWVPDVALQLQRNPNYFKVDGKGDRLPLLDGVTITFLRDTKSEFLEFMHGGYDMVTSVDASIAPTIYDANGKLQPRYSDFQIFRSPALSVEYYGVLLDTTKPGARHSPLATNKWLRQALNYAIDRHRIVAYVLHGKGIPARHGLLPPSLPGYDSTVPGYNYNPDEARRLLAKAGYPNGKGLPTLVLQLGNNPRTASVAEAIQEQWKEIGVSVELRQVDFPQHLSQVRAGELELWRTSWIADYPDAENFMALFISSNQSPAGPNTTHLVHRLLDSLYQEALKPGYSRAERSALYAQMQTYIVDEAPWIFLYHDVIIRMAQPNIHGLTVDGTGRLQLEHVVKSSSSLPS